MANGVRLVNGARRTDKSGRHGTKAIEGTDYVLPIDRAIVAMEMAQTQLSKTTWP